MKRESDDGLGRWLAEGGREGGRREGEGVAAARRETEERKEESLDIRRQWPSSVTVVARSRATLALGYPPPSPTYEPTHRLPFSLVESNYTRQDPPAREGEHVKLLRATEEERVV